MFNIHVYCFFCRHLDHIAFLVLSTWRIHLILITKKQNDANTIDKLKLLLTFDPRVLWQLQVTEPGYRVDSGVFAPVSSVLRHAGCVQAISAPARPQPAVCSRWRRPPAAVCTAPWAPTSASRATSCGHSPPPWHIGSPRKAPLKLLAEEPKWCCF